MPKNKLHIISLKPKLKTFIGPRPVRNITGNKVDKIKIRHAFVDTNGKITSERCISLEHATRRLSKMVLKFLDKVIFYDQNGEKHVMYDHNTVVPSSSSSATTDKPAENTTPDEQGND